MKKFTLVWLVMVLLLQAQAVPVAPPEKRASDTVAQHIVPVPPYRKLVQGKKPNFIQKAALRAMERKIVRKLKKGDDGNLRQKRTLGLIALISGIAGIVTLLTIPIVGVLLIPTALVTGIIGLSNNTDKRSRTHSIIGVVLGSTAIFLGLLFLILLLTWSWN